MLTKAIVDTSRGRKNVNWSHFSYKFVVNTASWFRRTGYWCHIIIFVETLEKLTCKVGRIVNYEAFRWSGLGRAAILA